MDHQCVGQQVIPFGVISLRSPTIFYRYCVHPMGARGNEWVWDSGCGDEDRANRIGIGTFQVINLIIVNTLDNHCTMGFSRTPILHFFVVDSNYCNTCVLWFLVISSLLVHLCFTLQQKVLEKVNSHEMCFLHQS